MIERAIENWLTSTNERNYLAPYCQVLLQRKHRIIYVSSHRPMEQGKDIITVDSLGDPCAYQLKTGDIDLGRWRSIMGEVKELIELPLVHPSADRSKLHKSFLVTNGDITDEVRFQISQINEDNRTKNRGYSYLDIVNGHTLLKEFIDAQGEFMPKELEEYRLFLELVLGDGADFLPRERYFEFLNSAVFGEIPKQKTTAISAIASSVVMTAYLLDPYQKLSNHFALFEAWTSLAASIVRYAERVGLKKEDWSGSLGLAISEIVRSLSLLKEETLERKDFLEGDWLADGGLVYRARATIVLGALATLEVYLSRTDKDHKQDDKLLKVVNDNLKTLWFWGESAFPYFFNLLKYLELAGRTDTAESLLSVLFRSVVERNSDTRGAVLPNPYYSARDVLEIIFGVDTGRVDFRQVPGTSYTLEPMILMTASRGRKEELEKQWAKISRIQFREFRVDNVEDIFTWRLEKGVNQGMFPKATQSWAELVRDANDLSGVPRLYLDHLDLLPFFILVCPHRATKHVIRLLDQKY